MALDALNPRDFFAAFALVALHATDDNEEQLQAMNSAARASWAYEMADEMMTARKKKAAPKKKPAALKKAPAAKARTKAAR